MTDRLWHKICLPGETEEKKDWSFKSWKHINQDAPTELHNICLRGKTENYECFRFAVTLSFICRFAVTLREASPATRLWRKPRWSLWKNFFCSKLLTFQHCREQLVGLDINLVNIWSQKMRKYFWHFSTLQEEACGAGYQEERVDGECQDINECLTGR